MGRPVPLVPLVSLVSAALLVCLLQTAFADEASDRFPEVRAPVGRIRGSIINSRLGRDIYSFRGVRYAEPPVGQQRFQPPIPIAEWEDVFDATKEGPGCPRLAATPGNISEDCLRLNVYTTKLPTQSENVKRPVIVFFHPGAFYVYTAQSFFIGPQYIMDKDLVFVTVAHRMATLGFISTGDSLAPGNLGMKDQVIALRWIKRNIAAFGGDPDSVTISGCSAGSWSVILHMVSPMSKGLFHRAIEMSGSPMGKYPLPTDQKHLAKKQAELLGCPTDTTGAMLVCLNSKPVENFTNTMADFFEYHGDPILIWQPVVEPVVHGIEQFLTEQPIDLFRQGRFHKVPVIIGITRDEFGGVGAAFEKAANEGNFTLFDNWNTNWTTLAPVSFLYERGTPRSLEISRELRQFYLNDGPLTPNNIDGIAHLYADSTVIFSVHRAAKLISENCDQPVYFYMFTYPGRYSFAMYNDTTPYGVVHQDDMLYLFYIADRFPFFGPNAPDVPMVERMTSMWYSFANSGEPVPRDDDRFRGVTWERYDSRRDNYLELDLTPTMKTGVYPDRMQLYERLFPLPPLPGSVKH